MMTPSPLQAFIKKKEMRMPQAEGQLFHFGGELFHFEVQLFHLEAQLFHFEAQLFHLEAQLFHLKTNPPLPKPKRNPRPTRQEFLFPFLH